MAKQTRRVVKLLCALAIALPLGAVLSVPIAGAEKLSVGVTPSFVDVEADAGESTSRALTVSNEGDAPFEVIASVASFPGSANARSARAWMTVAPSILRLDPGETQIMTVTIDVPAGLPSGGSYAQVTLTTSPLDNDEKAIEVSGRLSVPFLIAVDGPGDLTIAADIGQVTAVLEPDGRIGFQAEVTNTGNQHLLARGEIEVFQDDNASVGEVALQAAMLVLPGEMAVMAGQRSLLLEAGESYRAVVSVDIGPGEPQTVNFDFAIETPQVSIGELAICTNTGAAPSLQFALNAAEGLAIRPAIAISVRDERDQAVADLAVPEPMIVPGGGATSYAIDLPSELADSSYVLTVQLGIGASSLVTRSLDFRIADSGSGVAPSCD